MAWPKCVPTTWTESKPDDEPCPAGDVGEFTRGVDAKGVRFRKCRACARRNMNAKRRAKRAMERAA